MKPFQEQWQRSMEASLNPKQESLEEAVKRMYPNGHRDDRHLKREFINGAKWQAERDKEIINSLNSTLNKIGQKNINKLFKADVDDPYEKKYSEREFLNLLEFVNNRIPDLYSRFDPEQELEEWLIDNKEI